MSGSLVPCWWGGASGAGAEYVGDIHAKLLPCEGGARSLFTNSIIQGIALGVDTADGADCGWGGEWG